MSAKSPSFRTAEASMSVAEVGDWRDGAAGAIFGRKEEGRIRCGEGGLLGEGDGRILLFQRRAQKLEKYVRAARVPEQEG